MSDTSVAVQLGEVSGQQKMILLELNAAKEDRKQHYAAIDEIRGSIIAMNGRMTTVEDTLTTFRPTINEFIEIKHKVLAAGKLGKWLWLAGLALIGLAAKFRVELLSWVK